MLVSKRKTKNFTVHLSTQRQACTRRTATHPGPVVLADAPIVIQHRLGDGPSRRVANSRAGGRC